MNQRVWSSPLLQPQASDFVTSDPEDSAILHQRRISGPSQKKICNLQCEVLRNKIGTIAKNDDGQVFIWKTLDRSAKSGGFAVVPHPAVAFIRIEKPSKTVRGGLTIGLSHSGHLDQRKRRLHVCFA